MEKLQLITHPTVTKTASQQVHEALKGGCKWIQLRMKKSTASQIRHEAKMIMALKSRFNFTFIVNDDPVLAAESGADGVHLGKNDMSPSEARDIVGHRAIIGGTANTLEDIRRLANEGVNYIGLGPFTFTSTKAKLSPTLGLQGYESILAAMVREGISLPVVGIGGIEIQDAPDLLASGLHGLAISSAILQSGDIEKATRAWLQIICETTRRLSPEPSNFSAET